MKQLISFCHIPKTAGTSFESILKRNLPDRYYRFSEYKHPFGNYYEEKRDLVAIGGHYDWNFPFECGLFDDRGIKPIVFLREPVERCLSYLYFCNEMYHNDIVKFFTDKSAGDWKYKSNTMVKFLAGIDREPNKADLGLARERLKRSYVGFTETFDSDLENLREIFPDIFCTIEYEYKNKTKKDWHKISHDIDVIETIKSVNQYDSELYSWAKEILLWDKFLEG